MVRKTNVVVQQNVRGGEGTVEFHHILQEEELFGHGKLYAKVILKPHSSIGMHQHVGNTEPYYVLNGTGIFVDNDGTRTEVHPGDVCLIQPGQSHSMENNTDEDFEMMALIYNA